MKDYSKFLHKKIKVICSDDKKFIGEVVSFGGNVQGKEEYGRDEDFICIYTGDSEYVLFRDEIRGIEEV